MNEPGDITTVEWIRGRDGECGTDVLQLTSAPAIHTNVYLETPFMDAGSRFVLLTRSRDSFGPCEVWRADLEEGCLTRVCHDIDGITGMAVSQDQRFFYCVRRGIGGSFEILRVEIATLESHLIPFGGEPSPMYDVLGSVSANGRLYVAGAALPGRRFGILRIDLQTTERRVIHEGADLCNPHPQFKLASSDTILIQHNRGCEFDSNGRCIRLVGDEGATLYTIDSDGGSQRPLPVGKPHTWPVMGHECWIGETGEVLLTITGAPADEMIQRGNLLAAGPGDAAARVVATGHVYNHPNASRDGRFFVCDTFGNGSPLVVGSMKAGRTHVLCESGASFGSPQYTHAHPYFSPDNRWVIFNSDRTGVPHVYAARVAEGLLEGLE